MDARNVIAHLVERSGHSDRIALHRALVTTLHGVRDAVPRPLALQVADVLPATMAIPLRGSSHPATAPTDFDGLVALVRDASGLRPEAALEVTQSCLSFLGSLLDDELRDRLALALPPDWRPFVERREPHRIGGSTGAAIVHRDSIAANDDPHADTRLSSAHDVRTRKLSEAEPGAGARSLAEARPGAGPRSLAEATRHPATPRK